MYSKPRLERFGTLRELTLIGTMRENDTFVTGDDLPLLGSGGL